MDSASLDSYMYAVMGTVSDCERSIRGTRYFVILSGDEVLCHRTVQHILRGYRKTVWRYEYG